MSRPSRFDHCLVELVGDGTGYTRVQFAEADDVQKRQLRSRRATRGLTATEAYELAYVHVAT